MDSNLVFAPMIWLYLKRSMKRNLNFACDWRVWLFTWLIPSLLRKACLRGLKVGVEDGIWRLLLCKLSIHCLSNLNLSFYLLCEHALVKLCTLNGTWTRGWGLEPVAGDLNPAGIPTGTWTQGPFIEIAHLVSGLNEPQFFMSHHKKNKSLRDIVIGKKWTYLERNTLHRLWAISEGKRPWYMRQLVFGSWVILQTTEWDDYSNYFGEGGRDFKELSHGSLFDYWWLSSNCQGATDYVI